MFNLVSDDLQPRFQKVSDFAEFRTDSADQCENLL